MTGWRREGEMQYDAAYVLHLLVQKTRFLTQRRNEKQCAHFSPKRIYNKTEIKY